MCVCACVRACVHACVRVCCLLNIWISMSTFIITWHNYCTMLCQIWHGCIALEIQTSQFSEFFRVDNNSKSFWAVLITWYSAMTSFSYLRLQCHTCYLCVCIMFIFMKFKSIVNCIWTRISVKWPFRTKAVQIILRLYLHNIECHGTA